MITETDLRSHVHQLVDRLDVDRLEALSKLLDEDYYSPEEIAEIKQMHDSKERWNWREVRNDL
jgi:hypothetical protein